MNSDFDPVEETNMADAAEQRAAVAPEPEGSTPRSTSLEVPEADAAEQAAEVPLDEDDYPA